MSDVRPRLRFAPSPTGYLHVGGARAMLFNWLFARQQGGQMLLRIEDTDAERNRPELTDNILEMLEWLDLTWDDEPVHQSDNLDRHRACAQQLLDVGRAYWCDCTPEQVQARAKERGGPPGYDGRCRDRNLDLGPGRALRFLTPDDGATAFTDLIRGDVTFENAKLEDFVLLRSSGIPTFLLANAVDDADMSISHVVRGEEHVNGTPKYLLIADALALDHEPVFAHLPVLVNEQRQKLSKRRDSVSVAQFRDEGYLPEAMVNHLALLGWGPKDGLEIRPLEEIVELFRLEDVTPSPAFFDVKKLQAFNAEYVRSLDTDEFLQRARPFLTHGEESERVLRPLAELVQERVRQLIEVEPMISFLLDEPLVIDDASWQKEVGKHPDPRRVLEAALSGFESTVDWSAGAIAEVVGGIAQQLGFVDGEGRPRIGKVQGPIRVATTGRRVGPPLWESLEVLGRDRAVERLRAATERL
jgi:glutamyl-tRNA synthetase